MNPEADPGRALAAALEAAALALDGDDPAAAQPHVFRANALRARMEAEGTVLPREQIDRLREVLARCQAASADLHRRLEADMQRQGQVRRATDAYLRR